MTRPGSRVAAAALLASLTLACTTSRWHTAQPYASDLELGTALSERAAAWCSERYPEEDQQPTRRFATDGCSVFFDRTWDLECCVEHDIAYWCGGTRDQRTEADTEFGQCIAENTRRPLGFTMRWGVGIGGHPMFPMWYRWGYGHDYKLWYPSTSAQSGAPEPETKAGP